ncbi:hypothetical protein CAPTEDRAFT_199923 [Capitella teleta]|uniref:MATH domain-containing protein n=1 Tax=Capitella teleta TaxID=283909 RepID=R7ULA0_CAPTE|nr:hypothetical protein CAPTEDRAFT_199923 [Capitella teleta]|eukprot:ELU04022.1 hypothetical protein CAPTEDRAFT_199923 [Capitella teleta]
MNGEISDGGHALLTSRVFNTECTSVFLQTDTKESKPKSLAVFVQCKSDSSSTWSCEVSFELRLQKQKADGPPYTEEYTALFEPNSSNWGYDPFISWDELMDPENCYVKDDSIVIEVKLAVLK